MNSKISSLLSSVEKDIEEILTFQSEIVSANSRKVLSAFTRNKVSETDFSASTGYGYNDSGRDKLDRIFADIFNAESALVRPQIVSGTHAISLALFAVLRPGDTLISLTGTPYDTLKGVIAGEGYLNGSLQEFGITYREARISYAGNLNKELLTDLLHTHPKAVFIQRSRGYDFQPGLQVSRIAEIISLCKSISPGTFCLVDNCYGEFTDLLEPTDVGADLLAGSLIKNPGGSLAPSGGYLVGKKELIEAAGYRLTAPGIGGEVGGYLSGTRLFLQGLFYAPFIVGEALASATLAARLFAGLGFPVSPEYNEHRTDIVQAIQLGSAEKIIAFCQGLQKASPVDSHVSPVPWDMPGYRHPVIMAAGTFIQGSSIEISADAPIREPYNVYLQGGVSRHYSKIAIISVLEEMLERHLITL